jgi:hypothetical protein
MYPSIGNPLVPTARVLMFRRQQIYEVCAVFAPSPVYKLVHLFHTLASFPVTALVCYGSVTCH